MITRDFQILIQKLVLIADSDRYLCLTRELYICYEHAKRVYVYRLWGSLYHTINLSIIMKTILEGTFPHCPSNATVSLKSLLCLKEKWQMAVVLYFPLVFLFFFKCSQSWQQKQAKYNLDAWATALIVIRRILSFQWEHSPTIVRRGRTATEPKRHLESNAMNLNHPWIFKDCDDVSSSQRRQNELRKSYDRLFLPRHKL